jgi:hypothetical protein
MIAGADFLPGATVSLRSSRRHYTDEQRMEFVIATRGIEAAEYSPRLLIEGPGGRTELAPGAGEGGTFLARAGPFEPGAYEVTLLSNVGEPRELSMEVDVVPGSVERLNLSADPALMERIAEVSGARPVGPGEIESMAEVVRKWRASRTAELDRSALWDRWWLMAAAVAVLGGEWFLRRKEGLL